MLGRGECSPIASLRWRWSRVSSIHVLTGRSSRCSRTTPASDNFPSAARSSRFSTEFCPYVRKHGSLAARPSSSRGYQRLRQHPSELGIRGHHFDMEQQRCRAQKPAFLAQGTRRIWRACPVNGQSGAKPEAGVATLASPGPGGRARHRRRSSSPDRRGAGELVVPSRPRRISRGAVSRVGAEKPSDRTFRNTPAAGHVATMHAGSQT